MAPKLKRFDLRLLARVIVQNYGKDREAMEDALSEISSSIEAAVDPRKEAQLIFEEVWEIDAKREGGWRFDRETLNEIERLLQGYAAQQSFSRRVIASAHSTTGQDEGEIVLVEPSEVQAALREAANDTSHVLPKTSAAKARVPDAA